MAISLKLSSDLDYADIGDLIIYKIVIDNTENVSITNLKLENFLQEDKVLFIKDTVFYDDVLIPSIDMTKVVSLGNINANSSKKIEFQVAIKDFYPYSNITNKVKLDYTLNGTANTIESSIYTTTITKALVKIKKDGPLRAPKRSIIDYEITVENIGNTVGKKLRVRDIQDLTHLKFLGNLTTIDGNNIYPLSEDKIIVGDINQGESKVIVAKFLEKLGEVSEIENVSDCFYRYTVNPSDEEGSYGTYYSNFVKTSIIDVGVSITKSVMPTTIKGHKSGKFILKVENIGSTLVENVIVTDTITDRGELLVDKIYLDGVLVVNPISNGINLGNMNVGAVKTIEINFNVVQNVVDLTTITNVAMASYIYESNKTAKTISNGADLLLLKESYDITFTKSSDVININSGETITYIIDIKNNNENVLENVIFTDTINKYLKYVQDSFEVDGIKSQVIAPNIVKNVGSVLGNTTKKIMFKCIGLPIETTSIISNVGEINFNTLDGSNIKTVTNSVLVTLNGRDIIENVEVLESVNKDFLRNGEEVIYTVSIKNLGESDALNIIYTNTLVSNLEFVKDSVRINGIDALGSSILSGVNVGNLSKGETLTITYIAKAISSDMNTIVNTKGSIQYKFGVEELVGNSVGNGVKIFIKGNSIPDSSVEIKKTANIKYADISDVITYTIVIKNTGFVKLLDIIFKDTIANGSKFVKNSVYLGNINLPGSVEEGINIGNLDINNIKTITFDVITAI